MTEIWRSAIDSNKVVGIVLVDFQKAFDSHNVLLSKLKNSLQPGSFVENGARSTHKGFVTSQERKSL